MNYYSLRVGNLHAKPIHYDWSDGYGERWELVYPDVSGWSNKKCISFLKDHDDSKLRDKSQTLQELVQEYFQEEGSDQLSPMMNYYYPIELRHTPEESQAILLDAGLPLVVVYFTDESLMTHDSFALALSGGGMDLSWEICEAFIKLGQQPPIHFCRLPGMAGRGKSEGDKAIIAACLESIQIAKRWLENDERDLLRLSEEK